MSQDLLVQVAYFLHLKYFFVINYTLHKKAKISHLTSLYALLCCKIIEKLNNNYSVK